MLLCKVDSSVCDWLAKLNDNQINSDILLLIFKDIRKYSNLDIKLNEIKDKITTELTEKNISNYEILRIENIASLTMDTNTILIGYEGMDRKFLQNIPDIQILVYYSMYCERKSIFDEIMEEEDERYRNKLLCIIKKREPAEIICNYKDNQIKNYLLSYSLHREFQKKIQIFQPIIFPYWIQGDIKILYEKNILTARLAKIIYMVSTLNFNVSNREIGLYYKNVFGIKSKSKRLKEYNNRVYKVYCISEWLKNNNITGNKYI